MLKRIVLALLFFLPVITRAQVRTVTGTVTSARDNTPLPGATVSVKNTSIGGVTDPTGHFLISMVVLQILSLTKA